MDAYMGIFLQSLLRSTKLGLGHISFHFNLFGIGCSCDLWVWLIFKLRIWFWFLAQIVVLFPFCRGWNCAHFYSYWFSLWMCWSILWYSKSSLSLFTTDPLFSKTPCDPSVDSRSLVRSSEIWQSLYVQLALLSICFLLPLSFANHYLLF